MKCRDAGAEEVVLAAGVFYCRSHACQEKKNELESSGEEDE